MSLRDAIQSELAFAEGRRDEFQKLLADVESDIEALEDMLVLARKLEPDDAPEPPAKPKAKPRRKPEPSPARRAPGEADQKVIDVLTSSPVWLRRGEIERMVPEVNTYTMKDVLARLVALRKIAAAGERAGRRYGGPQFLGSDDERGIKPGPKQKKPPLPKEPQGTWERDSNNGDAEPSESCRVGNCVRAARERGYCDDHSYLADRFAVSGT